MHPNSSNLLSQGIKDKSQNSSETGNWKWPTQKCIINQGSVYKQPNIRQGWEERNGLEAIQD